jgi:F0F1-type ATP synthase epsilon subunit
MINEGDAKKKGTEQKIYNGEMIHITGRGERGQMTIYRK